MSRDIGVSYTQLYRKIKALTGQTINNFIRAMPLKRAAQLLGQHQQLTVSETTYKVGFTDLQHFRECFKKMYGVTPSQYAQKNPVRIKSCNPFVHKGVDTLIELKSSENHLGIEFIVQLKATKSQAESG